jgi:hypothetical protein
MTDASITPPPLICNACPDEKTLEDFYYSKTGKRLQPCKRCIAMRYAANGEINRARKRRAYAADPAKHQAQGRASHAAHREERQAKQKVYRDTHKEKRTIKKHEYYEENREDILTKDRAYNAEHKEERAAKNPEWNLKNKEKVAIDNHNRYMAKQEERQAAQRAYNAANPDKKRASDRLNRKNHPDIQLTLQARKRARKRNAPINDLSHGQWLEIQVHFFYACVYCPWDYEKCFHKTHSLTQDHIIALINGGNHTVPNVIPACRHCNSKKHTGPPTRYVQPLFFTSAPPKLYKPRTKKVGSL